MICTRNRADRLGPFLDAVAALDAPARTEIVLVDNGSTDDTAATLGRSSGPAGATVCLASEPRPGLGRARNTCWRLTTAPLVVFTDDDCYVTPSFLRDYLHAFDRHPDAGCIGGRVLLHDPADLRMTIQEHPHERSVEPRGFVPAGFIHGANFAFRRDVLVEAGGFDERLGAGTKFLSGEDTDMIANAVAAGWRAVYSPAPTVRHHHGRRSPEEAQRLSRGYDIGRGAYFAKHVLDRRVRWAYVRAWASRMRVHPWRVCARELRGGLTYTWARAMNRWPEH